MQERELLELAAKAFGLPLGYGDGQYFYCEHGPFGAGMYGRQGNAPLNWNPLTDDGEALRLAVKLKMRIGIDAIPIGSVVVVSDDKFRPDTHERIGSDATHATRRAIVRAAAEIGKAMP